MFISGPAAPLPVIDSQYNLLLRPGLIVSQSRCVCCPFILCAAWEVMIKSGTGPVKADRETRSGRMLTTAEVHTLWARLNR